MYKNYETCLQWQNMSRGIYENDEIHLLTNLVWLDSFWQAKNSWNPILQDFSSQQWHLLENIVDVNQNWIIDHKKGKIWKKFFLLSAAVFTHISI